MKSLLEATQGPLSAQAVHPLVEPDTGTLDLHRVQAETAAESDPAPALIYRGVSGS